MSDNPPKITISDAPKGDRPPRFNAKPRPAKVTVTASSQDLKKALGTLDSVYNLIATGLLVAGLSESATEWVSSAEQLKLSNEDALRASPKLAKAIANAGGTGGAVTFLFTHALAVAGLVKVATKELAERRTNHETETPDSGLS